MQHTDQTNSSEIDPSGGRPVGDPSGGRPVGDPEWLERVPLAAWRGWICRGGSWDVGRSTAGRLRWAPVRSGAYVPCAMLQGHGLDVPDGVREVRARPIDVIEEMGYSDASIRGYALGMREVAGILGLDTSNTPRPSDGDDRAECDHWRREIATYVKSRYTYAHVRGRRDALREVAGTLGLDAAIASDPKTEIVQYQAALREVADKYADVRRGSLRWVLDQCAVPHDAQKMADLPLVEAAAYAVQCVRGVLSVEEHRGRVTCTEMPDGIAYVVKTIEDAATRRQTADAAREALADACEALGINTQDMDAADECLAAIREYALGASRRALKSVTVRETLADLLRELGVGHDRDEVVNTETVAGAISHCSQIVREWAGARERRAGVRGRLQGLREGSAAGAREVAVVALSSLGAYDDATRAALREAEGEGFPLVAAVLTTRFRDLVPQLRDNYDHHSRGVATDAKSALSAHAEHVAENVLRDVAERAGLAGPDETCADIDHCQSAAEHYRREIVSRVKSTYHYGDVLAQRRETACLLLERLGAGDAALMAEIRQATPGDVLRLASNALSQSEPQSVTAACAAARRNALVDACEILGIDTQRIRTAEDAVAVLREMRRLRDAWGYREASVRETLADLLRELGVEHDRDEIVNTETVASAVSHCSQIVREWAGAREESARASGSATEALEDHARTVTRAILSGAGLPYKALAMSPGDFFSGDCIEYAIRHIRDALDASPEASYWRFKKIAGFSVVKSDDAQAFDPVQKPAHYAAGKVECIDAIEAALQGDADPVSAFLRGQVLKYIWRMHGKGAPLQDARKAAWYLERLIQHLDGEPEGRGGSDGGDKIQFNAPEERAAVSTAPEIMRAYDVWRETDDARTAIRAPNASVAAREYCADAGWGDLVIGEEIHVQDNATGQVRVFRVADRPFGEPGLDEAPVEGEVPVNGDVPARDEAPAMREYRVWRDGHSLPSLIRAADALAAIDTYLAGWPLENAVVHVQESGDAVVHVYRITQTGQIVRERFYHQGFGGDQ